MTQPKPTGTESQHQGHFRGRNRKEEVDHLEAAEVTEVVEASETAKAPEVAGCHHQGGCGRGGQNNNKRKDQFSYDRYGNKVLICTYCKKTEKTKSSQSRSNLAVGQNIGETISTRHFCGMAGKNKTLDLVGVEFVDSEG